MRRLQASDGMMWMGLLTDVVRSGVFGDHLLATTRRILYELRIIIPGRRRLSELAKQRRPSSAMHWRSSSAKSRLQREPSGQRTCRNQSATLT
jgi:hypothetical protein